MRWRSSCKDFLLYRLRYMYESLSLLFTPTTERHNFTEIKQAKIRGVLENLHYYTIISN